MVSIFIGAKMAPLTSIGNQANECYIDQIEFYIFKQPNGIQYTSFQNVLSYLIIF